MEVRILAQAQSSQRAVAFRVGALLEVCRNVFFTHAGKSRCQAIGSRLELSEIRGRGALEFLREADGMKLTEGEWRRLTATLNA
jgi:hypothetical protein